MKTRILLVQFRKSADSAALEQASIERSVGEGVELVAVSSLVEGLPWTQPEEMLQGIDGIIFGGSGDFDFDGGREEVDPDRKMSYDILDRLRPVLSHIFEHDLPTFGICYGHQLLGAFAGAQVYCDPVQKKTCSHNVKLVVESNDHFLFGNVPAEFAGIYGHKDVLSCVPEGAILLLEGGERCRVSALQYKNNIYSTQFHPELTVADMAERLKNAPGYLPEGVLVEDIYVDDANAGKLLHNFAQFVAKQRVGMI